jgi:hypothetical protein
MVLRTLTLSLVLATGCLATPGGGPPPGGDDDGSGSDPSQNDSAQYDALQTRLEANRSMFLPAGPTDLTGYGTRLFWLDFDTFSPSIHSFNTATRTALDYTFGIGTGDDYNFRVSDTYVVTAEDTGDNIVLHAFAIDSAAATSIDVDLPPTGGDVKWWAYAPDGADVYYVTTLDKTAVWKWTPSSGANTMLFNLEDLGVQVGEFQDFGVANGIMVFIESGRIWSLDLTTRQPIPLDNATEATAANQATDGVLALTATGPFWFSYGSKTLRDVAGAIAAASYKLNDTYPTIQDYESEMTQYQHQVGYIGQDGLFSFDLDANTVTPLLLDARDNSVMYTQPVFLDDGTVFVIGLTSDDGATGADGPVYQLDTKL